MELTDLQKAYGAAGRELRTLLLSIDLGTFDGAAAEVIKRKARRVVTVLNAVSGRWTKQISRREYAKAEKRTRATLAKMGKRRPTGQGPAVPGHERVREVTERALGRATGSIMQTVEQYVSAALLAASAVEGVPAEVQEFSYEDVEDAIGRLSKTAVKKELSRGKLQSKIMKMLRKYIDKEGLIKIGERMYDARKYARLVARTVLRQAQTAATLDLCKRYENELVQVSDHGTVCDICKEYEGNTYSLSGASKRYPHLENSPPFHPNCMHSILPISAEEISVRRREKGR